MSRRSSSGPVMRPPPRVRRFDPSRGRRDHAGAVARPRRPVGAGGSLRRRAARHGCRLTSPGCTARRGRPARRSVRDGSSRRGSSRSAASTWRLISAAFSASACSRSATSSVRCSATNTCTAWWASRSARRAPSIRSAQGSSTAALARQAPARAGCARLLSTATAVELRDGLAGRSEGLPCRSLLGLKVGDAGPHVAALSFQLGEFSVRVHAGERYDPKPVPEPDRR